MNLLLFSRNILTLLALYKSKKRTQVRNFWMLIEETSDINRFFCLLYRTA